MNKKLAWLEKHGGKEAVETFRSTISKMENFAQAAELPYKEVEQVGNLLIDEEVETIAQPTTEVVIEKENEEDVEILVDAIDPVPDVVVGKNDEVEVAKEFVTIADFEAAIDELINSAVAPLADALTEQIQLTKNLSAELENVRKEIGVMTKQYEQITEVDEVLDTIPSAAAITHIQSRLTNAMKQFSTVSKADEGLIERKPAENIQETGQVSEFDLFLSGQ